MPDSIPCSNLSAMLFASGLLVCNRNLQTTAETSQKTSGTSSLDNTTACIICFVVCGAQGASGVRRARRVDTCMSKGTDRSSCLLVRRRVDRHCIDMYCGHAGAGERGELTEHQCAFIWQTAAQIGCGWTAPHHTLPAAKRRRIHGRVAV